MTATDLVTGADGFVGRHLVRRLLARGRSVNALDLSLRGIPDAIPDADEVRRFEGDLGDPRCRQAALVDPEGHPVDTVYHLAAAHLGVRVPDAEYRRINVEATAELTADAAAVGIRRFVHISSVGVYGQITDPPADESTPCRPEHAYERTKLDGEAAVLAVHARQGLPAVVLRPAWIYGPGCGRTEKLFRAIGRRRFVVAGDGSGWRHGIFIDDFLTALELASTAEAALGQIVVVADDAAAPVGAWLSTIAELIGAPPPPKVPLRVFRAAATVVEAAFRIVGREPPVSRRTLRFFTADTAFDTTRARNLLGFEPRFDLRSGLAETARRLGLTDAEPS